MSNVNLSSIESILSAFEKVLKVQSGSATTIPTPLIITGVPRRSGLSPSKIASRIIARKAEAGIPVGVLPSGGISPDEVMERIRIEEIIKAIHEDGIVSIGIPPGTPISASGISPAGPVAVVGSTVSITKGYGIIQ